MKLASSKMQSAPIPTPFSAVLLRNGPRTINMQICPNETSKTRYDLHAFRFSNLFAMNPVMNDSSFDQRSGMEGKMLTTAHIFVLRKCGLSPSSLRYLWVRAIGKRKSVFMTRLSDAIVILKLAHQPCVFKLRAKSSVGIVDTNSYTV